MPETVDPAAVEALIIAAIKLAIEFREITGRPLGITGEVGEFHAAKLLGLRLADARQPGYDAVAPDCRRVQIKARCLLPGAKSGQRLGRTRLDHEWDTVTLVLLDGRLSPTAIYEAQRADVKRELTRPGSKSRNERGALSVSKFKSIATLVWRE